MTSQALYLVDEAVHRGARADEAGEQELERPLGGRFDRLWGTLAYATQLKALTDERAANIWKRRVAASVSLRAATMVQARGPS